MKLLLDSLKRNTEKQFTSTANSSFISAKGECHHSELARVARVSVYEMAGVMSLR